MNHKTPSIHEARPRRIAVGAVALVATAGLMAGACHRDAGADHETEPVVVRAQLAVAERIEHSLETEIFGTVEAGRTAAVSARVMAMVTAVEVRAGDRVRRGTTLLEIDPQAAEGQLAQARGALAQARAAETLAERNYRRFEALAATDAASELELDTARMHYEQARGAVEQAEGAVRAAASVAGDARVRAPFDGRVVRRMVEVGDLAAPGRPLLMIESEDDRRLVLAIPESAAARASLDVGATVPVAIDTRPDLGVFSAPLVEVAPGVDPMTHTLTAKVGLVVGGVASGASGRAWISTGRRDLVAVPHQAILERGGLTMVVLATPDGYAATRVVTVGRKLSGEGADARVEVLSGLAGGETVLLGLVAPPPAGALVEEI